MTIWKLGFFLLKTILTLCQVIILLYTMSHAHKVVHISLNSISGQHSASFHMVIENVADIFFPKWALLERCEVHSHINRVSNLVAAVHSSSPF